ncbi:hypothetical protein BGZ76_002648 [Entomortierella beljakovae]|nr:hypothetical protein BGZ76_002648 [Entomortierella beljakovae]
MAKTDTTTPPGTGYVETLTPEQKECLKRMWAEYFRYVDSGEVNQLGQEIQSSLILSSIDSDTSSTKSKGSIGKKGWFGSNKSSRQQQQEKSQNDISSKVCVPDIGIACEKIRPALWGAILGDNPDSLLLRFMRARKWNVELSMNMFLKVLKWRTDENIQELISKNEDEIDIDYPGFRKQFQTEKLFLHGTDKQGQLLMYINVRQHKPSDQEFKTMEKAILYLVETARITVEQSVGKATLVLDMSGFGLSNVDYGFVKYMVQTFEAYYPESLGIMLIHKAPLIFWGVWKVIEPWLDPVVASKVRFTRNDKELVEYIDASHIISKYEGGLDKFKFQFIPADPNENSRMGNLKAKERAQEEWKAVLWKYEALTREWVNCKITEGSRSESVIEAERSKVCKDLRKAYYKLDPYIRARTQYHRSSQTTQPVIHEDGSVHWVYNN